MTSPGSSSQFFRFSLLLPPEISILMKLLLVLKLSHANCRPFTSTENFGQYQKMPTVLSVCQKLILNSSQIEFSYSKVDFHSVWKSLKKSLLFYNIASEASYVYIQNCLCPNNIYIAPILPLFVGSANFGVLFLPLFVGSVNFGVLFLPLFVGSVNYRVLFFPLFVR